MSTTEATAPPADTGTIEALKRIKAAEVEWDQRIAEAKREAARALERMRQETEAAVAAAHEQAERERTRAVEAARANADLEAQEILARGEREAATVLAGEGTGVAGKKEEILSAVLSSFYVE